MEDVSVEEALALAKIREENAKEFYDLAVEKVELSSAKNFLKELSVDEERHINMIAELQRKITGEGKAPEFKGSVQNLDNVNDDGQELDKNASFLDILRSAITREHDAVKEYTNLAESVQDGKVKDLFKLLLNEEKNHLRKFEEDYDDFTDEMSHKKVRELISKMIK